MVSLIKGRRRSLHIVGEVPVMNRSDDGGDIVATAKVEKLKSGAQVYHIDLSDHSVDILLRGFSLGTLTTDEEEGK